MWYWEKPTSADNLDLPPRLGRIRFELRFHHLCHYVCFQLSFCRQEVEQEILFGAISSPHQDPSTYKRSSSRQQKTEPEDPKKRTQRKARWREKNHCLLYIFQMDYFTAVFPTKTRARANTSPSWVPSAGRWRERRATPRRRMQSHCFDSSNCKLWGSEHERVQLVDLRRGLSARSAVIFVMALS